MISACFLLVYVRLAYSLSDEGCWTQLNTSQLVYVDGNNKPKHAHNLNFYSEAYKMIKTTDRPPDTAMSVHCDVLYDYPTFLSRHNTYYIYPPGSKPCENLAIDDEALAIRDLLLSRNIQRTLIFYAAQLTPHLNSLVSSMNKAFHQMELWLVHPWQQETIIQKAFNNLDTFVKHFIVFTETETAFKIIKQARVYNFTNADWTWIIRADSNISQWESWLIPGEKVVLVSHQQMKPVLSQCGRMVFADNEREVTLKVKTLSREVLENVAIWRPSSGYLGLVDSFWHFTKFHNKTFTIATIDLSVFHYRRKEGNSVVWDGIVIEMLKTMAEELNFRYKLVPSVDGKWGGPDNGSGNGMVGMVMRQDVDFALAKFTVTALRDSVIDFSTPFWYEPAVIVMLKPQEDSLWVYVGPFGSEVWLCLIVSIPVCGLIIGLFIHWERTILERNPQQPNSAISIGFLFSYGSFVQQSYDIRPRTLSLRFLVGFWWFFTIVIAATYTGNLIAVLAVPKSTLPVQTLADLAAQSRYKYGVMDGAALHSLFELSGAEIYRTLYQNSIQYEENRADSHEDGLNKVKNGDYIYIGEKSGVASAVYSDCDYAIGRETFSPGAFAMVFPENSPYIRLFNKIIHQSTESGMIEKWKRKYYPDDRCTLEAATTARLPDPASIQDTQGAVIILGIGLGTATLVLSAELLLNYFRRKRLLTKKFTRAKDVSLPKLSSTDQGVISVSRPHGIVYNAVSRPESEEMADENNHVPESLRASNLSSGSCHTEPRHRNSKPKSDVIISRTLSMNAVDAARLAPLHTKNTTNGITRTFLKENGHSNGYVNGIVHNHL